MRFIHTADIHFGMENYGKIDPQTGIHSRLLDFVSSLTVCIDYAIAQNVDFFLFCGDAYKTHHPTQMQQRLFVELFLRLYKAEIPVVIIVGNHDNPLSSGKAHALNLFDQLPLDGFYVFDKPGCYELKTKSGMVTIVGIPWPTRNILALKEYAQGQSAFDITAHISECVAHIIQRLAEQINKVYPAILAGHLTVSSGIFSGSEKKAIYGTDPLFLPSQLALEPFNYVALGHLHRFQNLNPSGIPVVYSGSIDRVDFGERNEEKGFVDVVIDEAKNVTFAFQEIKTRKFLQIEVVLKKGPQTQQILDEIAKHDIEGVILKVLYYVPSDEVDSVIIASVEKACQSAHYVVGIFPIIQPKIRSQRAIVPSVGISFSDQLEAYFAAHQHMNERKKFLIEKVASLLLDEDD